MDAAVVPAGINGPLPEPSHRREIPPLKTNAFPSLKDGHTSMPDRLAREHLLAALLESPEDAVLSVFHDGTIDTWSRGAERIYGYAARPRPG
jgi:PAS domain-containing protein